MVQIDGSATKKVGGAGVVLLPPEGETLRYAVKLQFTATNNETEYEALLIGLSPGKALGARNLIVQVDSQLIIGQLKGDYEAKEERNIQKPVYYTSQAFQGAEASYPRMEKIDFTLLVTFRKLHPYFKAHLIIVMTDQLIRKTMNNIDAAGLLIQ